MSDASPRILCVHQGYELYGSDRTFAQSLRALRERFPGAHVQALLPRDGPLVPLLRPAADTVEFDELFVLRRGTLGARSLARLPRAVLRARARIDACDLTYVNTVVVADYLLAARLTRRPVLAHVHELPLGPERFALSALLAWSGARLLFNSSATRQAFRVFPGQTARVVPNGTAAASEPVPPAGAGLEGRPMRVLMLGRFSTWKGQGLLVEAVGALDAQSRRRLRVRLLGDVFDGRTHHRDEVQALVDCRGLGEIVSLEPFTPDPHEAYAWADVVVVPSTRPEPFGLTAIEAMARGRPVIGADHGGLREIVEDSHTGARFAPGDARALAAALESYLEHPDRLQAHGAAALARYHERFEERVYLDAIGREAAAALSTHRNRGQT